MPRHGCLSIPQAGFRAFRQMLPYLRVALRGDFQSLKRASGPSDCSSKRENNTNYQLSIPQAGLRAFRPINYGVNPSWHIPLSIPQAGFRAFRLNSRVNATRATRDLSIPQAGLRAFRLLCHANRQESLCNLSIPQAGFRAFRLVSPSLATCKYWRFQSLKRASGPSDSLLAAKVFRGNGQFQSLKRASAPSDAKPINSSLAFPCSFNPSSGLPGFPTWAMGSGSVAFALSFNPSSELMCLPTFS